MWFSGLYDMIYEFHANSLVEPMPPIQWGDTQRRGDWIYTMYPVTDSIVLELCTDYDPIDSYPAIGVTSYYLKGVNYGYH